MGGLIKWLFKLGDAFSQLINAVLLNGSPNESISGRAWRTRSVWYKIIDTIMFFDKHHCEMSYLNDIDYCRKYLNEF